MRASLAFFLPFSRAACSASHGPLGAESRADAGLDAGAPDAGDLDAVVGAGADAGVMDGGAPTGSIAYEPNVELLQGHDRTCR